MADLRPSALDPRLAQLAQMLISKQRANAAPAPQAPMGFPGNGAPALPTMAPQVNPAGLAALYKNFQTGQSQANAVPPDVVRNTQPPAGMPAQAPPVDATAVPPMPPPTTIGAASSTQQPGALADVWAALQKLKGQGSSAAPSWAQNFGNLADIQGR